MKPLRMSLCGIKSFCLPAEIDFEALSQGGIFGVFGNTGAGKSTVVDAILFALYGETGDAALAEIVNRRSERATVTLAFSEEDANGVRRTYEVSRSIRLNKDRTKSPVHNADLYETTGGSKVAIASGSDGVTERVTQLLRLDKEDFQNCVVLKQGKYDKFVRAKPAQRKHTVVALFGLQRYGAQLLERVKARRVECEKTLARLTGGLEALGDTDDAALKASLAAEAAAERAAQTEKQTAERLREAVASAERDAEAFAQFVRCDAEAREALADDGGAKTALAAMEAACKETAERQTPVLAQAERDGTAARALALQLEQAFDLDRRLAEAERAERDTARDRDTARAALASAEDALARAQAAREQARLSHAKAIAYVHEQFGLDLPETDEASGALNAFAEKLRNESEQLGKAQAALQTALTGRENAQTQRDETEQTAKVLRARATDAERRAEAARAAFEEARFGSAIDELARGLHAGDTCPVCGNIVTELPAHAHADTDAAKAAAEAAEAERRKADEEARTAEQILAAANQKADAAEKQLADAQAACAACNADATAEKVALAKKCVERFSAILRDERAAQQSEAAAQQALAERRGKADVAVQAADAAQKNGAAVRAEAARLLPEGGTVAEALAAARARANTADETAKGARDAIEQAKERVTAARTRTAATAERLRMAERALAACTVRAFDTEAHARKKAELQEAIGRSNDAQAAFARAQADAARMRENHEKAKDLRRRKNEVAGELALVRKLEGLVDGNKFAEWIAEEYIKEVAEAASKRLRTFTGGEMGLAYDEGFWIEDYLNGGARCKLTTVSGGETFLVSLAVAIAVAAKLGERAGASHAEFMFIDEGFGTLSPDKLDAVMDALTGLARENVTIGFISHVSELETRIPCRLVLDRSDPERGSICTAEGV